MVKSTITVGKDSQKRKFLSLKWKSEWGAMEYYNNNDNDRLTAFDPGQPG